MDGYTIWLAPITGILLADYYVVQRQSYVVPELYQPNARYRYNRLGTNWRALLAWCVSWIPLIPGFAHAVSSSTNVSIEGLHLYYLSYLFGLVLSSVLYVSLSLLFQPGCTKTPVCDGISV